MYITSDHFDDTISGDRYEYWYKIIDSKSHNIYTACIFVFNYGLPKIHLIDILRLTSVLLE